MMVTHAAPASAAATAADHGQTWHESVPRESRETQIILEGRRETDREGQEKKNDGYCCYRWTVDTEYEDMRPQEARRGQQLISDDNQGKE